MESKWSESGVRAEDMSFEAERLRSGCSWSGVGARKRRSCPSLMSTWIGMFVSSAGHRLGLRNASNVDGPSIEMSKECMCPNSAISHKSRPYLSVHIFTRSLVSFFVETC